MTTTEQAIALVNGGAAANAAAIARRIISACSAWRPDNFNTNIEHVRAHYIGRGGPLVAARLKALYPESGDTIPVWPYPWVNLQAKVAACVYDLTQIRTLVNEKGEPVELTDARAIRWAEILDHAQVDNKMAECERRASTGAKSNVVVVRARRQMVNGVKRYMPSIDLFWSSDVYVLPSAESPEDLQMAHAVALRIAGPAGPNSKGEFWELWTRPETTGEDGVPVGDTWFMSQLSSEGELVFGGVEGEEYKGSMLPIAIYKTAVADVGPWPIPNDEDAVLAEATNADISDSSWMEGMQGHTDRVYSGTQMKGEDVKGGAGRTIKVGPGETIVPLDYNPKIAERRESIRERLRMLAVSRRQSPSAYVDKEGSQTESGTARMVALEPQTKARDEQLKEAAVFERTFSSILIDVNDTYCIDEQVISPCRQQWTPAKRPQYESFGDVLRNAIDARDAGLISDARAAVLIGEAKDIKDAEDKKYSNVRASTIDKNLPGWVESGETEVDDKEPQDEETKTPPAMPVDSVPVEAVADTAMNGAQVQALGDIVAKTSDGTYNKDTAKAILAVAFPTMTPDQINSIINPIQVKVPVEVKTAPPAGV